MIDTTEHPLDLATIQADTAKFNRLRYAATQELAAIFAASEAGQPEEQPSSERTATIRTRAGVLLNGSAPAGMKLPVAVSRKSELELEVEALDLVLVVCSQQELVARAAAAELFAEKNADAWIRICRETILDGVRATTRQAAAVSWRQNLGGVVPGNLPLARFVGHGRPLSAAELSRAIAEALELGIVTQKELKAAQNA